MERIEITNAIYALKSDFKGCKYVDEPTNESEYESIEWVTGLDSIGSCIYGTLSLIHISEPTRPY